MPRTEPSFSFGIEEEFFLVNQESRNLVSDIPPALLASLQETLGKRFTTEFMRSQLEISTPVCKSSAEARRELIQLRRSIVGLAGRHGLAPIAAGTHPFAHWREQRHTDLERYDDIAADFQGVGRRMLICGLHVHVGIEDDDTRIAVMNELSAFLPLLLALSTSSPFWQGELTGLASYRTAINDATPRKGVPEQFNSWRDYQRAVGVLVDSGIVPDASKIWWDLRPSAHISTLEMRITDVCPLVADAICLAALVRCLCRYCYRISLGRRGLPGLSLLLINENRWRAERYGTEAGLIDLSGSRIVAVAELVGEMLDLIREDAEHFDCVAEVERARSIVVRGASAVRQVRLYNQMREQGLSTRASLAGVVDMLIVETAADLTRQARRQGAKQSVYGGVSP